MKIIFKNLTNTEKSIFCVDKMNAVRELKTFLGDNRMNVRIPTGVYGVDDVTAE